MNRFLSDVAVNAKSSVIREILRIAVSDDAISFGGGLPSPDSFPISDIQEVINETMEEHGYKTMQYGATEGLPQLLDEIAKLMENRNLKASRNDLLISTGSQQALDLCGKVLINEGDYIICERPTYLSALSAFRSYKPRFLGVEMDDEGLNIDGVEENLKKYPVKFIYTIPDFQNPSGRTLSVDRRKKLAQLARKYDTLIVEDSPYSELNFDSEVYPTVKSFDEDGRVIYLSTFSKIICPGFRLGWIHSCEPFHNKFAVLKQGMDLHTNQFVQYVVYSYLKKYDIKEQIVKIRNLYSVKRDAMVKAVNKYFPEKTYCSNPKGGMFLWIELPGNIDTEELFEKSKKENVFFVPGNSFFTDNELNNAMRLNFSNASIDEIDKGMRIIGRLSCEMLEKNT